MKRPSEPSARPDLLNCENNATRDDLKLPMRLAHLVVEVFQRCLYLPNSNVEALLDRLTEGQHNIRVRSIIASWTLWNLENSLRLRLDVDATPERAEATDKANVELQKIYLRTWGLSLSREDQTRLVLAGRPSLPTQPDEGLRAFALQAFTSGEDSLETALAQFLLRTSP